MSNLQTNKGLKTLMSNDLVKSKFNEVLGDNSSNFIASLLNTINNNSLLVKADPNTIMQAAMVAATLNLPVDPNLGFAYIVPYKSNAQFQMGYRGFVQLALRTSQYRNINVVEIDKAHFVSFNPLTEEIETDFTKEASGEICGYAAYFELLNGFKKTVFWSKGKVEKHGKRYSQSFNSKYSPWQTDFDGMGKKTVLKSMLSKWGIMSVEMQTAITSDQAVINNAETKDIDHEDITEQVKIEVKGEKEELSSSHPRWAEMVKLTGQSKISEVKAIFSISKEIEEELMSEAMKGV